MPQYKPGTLLRCVDPYDADGLTYGKEYVVIDSYPTGVSIINDYDRMVGYLANRFEKLYANDLFDAFMRGSEITLRSNEGVNVTGVITSMARESGMSGHQVGCNVILHVGDGAEFYNIYVRFTD